MGILDDVDEIQRMCSHPAPSPLGRSLCQKDVQLIKIRSVFQSFAVMRLAAPIRRLIPWLGQLGQAGHPDDQNGVLMGSCGNFGWLKQKHAKKFRELNILNFIHKAVRFDANISFCSLHRYPTGKGIHRIRMVFHLLKPILNCAYHEPHDVSNWSKLRKIEGSAWYHFPRFYWSTAG